jgi:NAD(P) transhydrogenase subunit alpha
MSAELVAQITVLVLAAFVGIEVISKVPAMLHTPLMSATNAIHGVVLVGALLVLGSDPESEYVRTLGFIAVVFGAMNVVGGFVVTDRMLGMFRARERRQDEERSATEAGE